MALPEGYTLEQPSAAQPAAQPSAQPQQIASLPPGYTLEQPSAPQTPSARQGGGLPPGYTLEGSAPTPTPQKVSPEQQASNIRQSAVAGMTGMPTPNMNDADKADFESGKRAGAITAGGAEVLSPLVPAAGVIPQVIEHLGGLTKIVQVAKNLGWTGMTLKEAHDIYKMVSKTVTSSDDK